jgi:hypothetical protein
MKKNITFISSSPCFWDSHQTIFESFSQDNNYTVKVVANDIDFFHQKNIDAIPIYNNKKFFNLNRLSSDLIFRDLPYCPQFDINTKGYTLSNLRGNPKICHIPYGMLLGVVEKKFFAHPFFDRCWKVFLDSEFKKNLVGKFYDSKVLNDKFIVSGYPKHDAYLDDNMNNDNTLWGNIALNENIKRIIWAPHWSISHYEYREAKNYNYENGYSTFLKYKNYFLSILDKYKDLNIILRPHPNLFRTLLEFNYMTNSEIEKYKKEFCSKGNGQIISTGTYMNLFKISDALITDCSSFLGEYLPSGHPVLHLKRNLSPGFNEQGTNIINSYYSADNKEHIDKFINDVVFSKNDHLAEHRRSAMNQYLYINNKGAGKFIKQYIHKELNKESSVAFITNDLYNGILQISNDINKIIRSLSIQYIIDINLSHNNVDIFKHIPEVNYHGVSYNLDLITNIKNYFIDYKHMSFEAIDVTKNILPTSDMVLLLEPQYIGDIQELSSFLRNIKSNYLVMSYSSVTKHFDKLIPEPLYLYNINIETLGIWSLNELYFYLDDTSLYINKPHRKFIIKTFINLINELRDLLSNNKFFFSFIDSLTYDNWSECYKLLSQLTIVNFEKDRTHKLCAILYSISFKVSNINIENFDKNFKTFELDFLSYILRNVAHKYKNTIE